MKRLWVILGFTILVARVCFGQTVKLETDTVITYCKFSDLVKAIHKEYSYSISMHWVTLNGKKKEIIEYYPRYQDSLLALKKLPNDTIILPYDEMFDELEWEVKRLARQWKLTFFDKRNKKKVASVKK